MEYQNVMVQLMEERVQNSATVAEYKQVCLKLPPHDIIYFSCVISVGTTDG